MLILFLYYVFCYNNVSHLSVMDLLNFILMTASFQGLEVSLSPLLPLSHRKIPL